MKIERDERYKRGDGEWGYTEIDERKREKKREEREVET